MIESFIAKNGQKSQKYFLKITIFKESDKKIFIRETSRSSHWRDGGGPQFEVLLKPGLETFVELINFKMPKFGVV